MNNQIELFNHIEQLKNELGVYGQLELFEPIKELCPLCNGAGGNWNYDDEWEDCGMCDAEGVVYNK